MAGSYPDAPWRRMAYDQDGTVMWVADPQSAENINWGQVDTTTIDEQTETQKGYANDESNTTWVAINGNSAPYLRSTFIAMIFPELRDLYGLHIWLTMPASPWTYGHVFNVETSTDTTNGIDGTWTSHWSSGSGEFPPTWDADYSSEVYYRAFIESMTATGVRSLRFVPYVSYELTGASANRLISTHVYGGISSGETPDRLLFVDDSTGLELTEPMDWGDVPRGTSFDKVCKIKNNSSTLDANTVTLAFEALTGTSNTWYTAKEGAGAFNSPLSLTTDPITAGNSSGTITIRQTIDPAETLSLAACRAYLTVGSWT